MDTGRRKVVSSNLEHEEGWETYQGDVVDRTRRIGRNVRRFRSKHFPEQVQHAKTFGDPDLASRSNFVSSLGRSALHLRSINRDQHQATNGGEHQPSNSVGGNDTHDQEYDVPYRQKAADESSSDEDEDDGKEPPSWLMEGGARDAVGLADSDDETEDTTLHQRMTGEEFDTTQFTGTQIVAAMNTLFEQVETSETSKGLKLATGMISAMVKRHREAFEHLDTQLMNLCDKAFIYTNGKSRKPESIRLTEMFQDIAPLVALKMAQIGCAAKATRLLTLHTHTAARFLQTAWRRHRFEKKFAASTPPDVCLRQRAVFAVCISEIKKSLFPKDPSKAIHIDREALPLLKVLNVLTSERQNPQYNKDRIRVAKDGVLPALMVLALNESQSIRNEAASVLTHLASTAPLRIWFMRFGGIRTLCSLLCSTLVSDRTHALEIADLVLMAAIPPKSVASVVWADALADPTCVSRGGPVQVSKRIFTTRPVFDRVGDLVLEEWEALRAILESNRFGLVECLTQLLKSVDDNIRLGSCMAIERLCLTPCTFYVWGSPDRANKILTSLMQLATNGCSHGGHLGVAWIAVRTLCAILGVERGRGQLIEAGFPALVSDFSAGYRRWCAQRTEVFKSPAGDETLRSKQAEQQPWVAGSQEDGSATLVASVLALIPLHMCGQLDTWPSPDDDDTNATDMCSLGVNSTVWDGIARAHQQIGMLLLDVNQASTWLSTLEKLGVAHIPLLFAQLGLHVLLEGNKNIVNGPMEVGCTFASFPRVGNKDKSKATSRAGDLGEQLGCLHQGCRPSLAAPACLWCRRHLAHMRISTGLLAAAARRPDLNASHLMGFGPVRHLFLVLQAVVGGLGMHEIGAECVAICASACAALTAISNVCPPESSRVVSLMLVADKGVFLKCVLELLMHASNEARHMLASHVGSPVNTIKLSRNVAQRHAATDALTGAALVLSACAPWRDVFQSSCTDLGTAGDCPTVLAPADHKVIDAVVVKAGHILVDLLHSCSGDQGLISSLCDAMTRLCCSAPLSARLLKTTKVFESLVALLAACTSESVVEAKLLALVSSLTRAARGKQQALASNLLAQLLTRHNVERENAFPHTPADIQAVLMLGRIANFVDQSAGSANHIIAGTGALVWLLNGVATFGGQARSAAAIQLAAHSANQQAWTPLRSCFAVTFAIAQLAQDPIVIIGAIAEHTQVIPVLGELVRGPPAWWGCARDHQEYHHVEKQSLRILFAVAKFPMFKYIHLVENLDIEPVLQSIGLRMELQGQTQETSGVLARQIIGLLKARAESLRGKVPLLNDRASDEIARYKDEKWQRTSAFSGSAVAVADANEMALRARVRGDGVGAATAPSRRNKRTPHGNRSEQGSTNALLATRPCGPRPVREAVSENDASTAKHHASETE